MKRTRPPPAFPEEGENRVWQKLERLRRILGRMESAALAFSGGVDSSFLLAVASSVLGKRLVAVTGRSPTYPASELKYARRIARKFGARHIVIDSHELDIPQFRLNPAERCYHCKKELFSAMGEIARTHGISCILDATTRTDLSDFRPGRKAAQEHGVRSPLLEAGMSKQDVRELSRRMGLETWNKPAMACLASRFPFGTEITPQRLRKVEKAEAAMRRLGIEDCRVRFHGELCRIELPLEKLSLLLDPKLRPAIVRQCRRAGFKFVTADLEGYIPAGKRR